MVNAHNLESAPPMAEGSGRAVQAAESLVASVFRRDDDCQPEVALLDRHPGIVNIAGMREGQAS
jgi:hypothetical protein